MASNNARSRRTDADEAPRFGTNLGSVDLVEAGFVTPEWSRRRYKRGDHLAHLMVGHENGVPDIYRTSHPAEVHQFAWVDPNNERDLNNKYAGGFDFVTESDWTKSVAIWRWKEGRAWTLGMNLMFRPAAVYFEEKREREQRIAPRGRQHAAANELLVGAAMQRDPSGELAHSLGLTDADGRRLQLVAR